MLTFHDLELGQTFQFIKEPEVYRKEDLTPGRPVAVLLEDPSVAVFPRIIAEEYVKLVSEA